MRERAIQDDGQEVFIESRSCQLEVDVMNPAMMNAVRRFLVRASRLHVSVGMSSLLYAYFEDESAAQDAEFWLHEHFTGIQTRIRVDTYQVNGLLLPQQWTLEEALKQGNSAIHTLEWTRVWIDEDEVEDDETFPIHAFFEYPDPSIAVFESMGQVMNGIPYASDPYWTTLREPDSDTALMKG